MGNCVKSIGDGFVLFGGKVRPRGSDDCKISPMSIPLNIEISLCADMLCFNIYREFCISISISITETELKKHSTLQTGL
jgi:hypothetical protein